MKNSLWAALSIIFLFPAVSAARHIPTFRGFPVYPPQEIDSIAVAEEGDVEFNLALSSRETMLQQLGALDSRMAKVQDTKKITLEFDIAKSYIQRNAALLGWQIKSIDETWGKDSQEMIFVKKKDPLREVLVTIWTGKISFTYGGILVTPKNTWGYITYRFYEKEK
ncbi:MAG TPA: hypothetical protein PKL77_04200 [Candidatus Omnitrophota bacterium]|nr:hypothetical protein [Candidatus Omnitrophota bacterium]HPT06848.1 hypothetical protein [Candidatus Omnitrophota bacterium]